MNKISEVFGTMVFNDAVMREKLPKSTYKELKKHMAEGTDLTLEVANVVASAMKDWALEKGATHFTHWFQPMTGITAEKHDSFLSPMEDGGVIMEFSGKELIKGEPDASSFPSGGIRATFEARGYTSWDPSSFAFIKDDTLCIPTAFCSYGGEALDKKTPLLRSMETLNREAVRVLKALGRADVERVITTVGPEQEYFLLDKELYNKRKDLIYCGRTLFGAKPPKRQELEDHYFGVIKPKVRKFMEDLDEELWKLGVLANTEHNEVAPSQHELAPIFTTANIAADHNQLTMELMKKVADRNGLACLLTEKPFAGVNGSGKHINWSMATEDGENLLNPGKDPAGNLQFLLFLAAVIQAVDDYQDLLRVSVASPGNDHRLGGSEAPPAILSMFIGADLEEILDAMEKGEPAGSAKDHSLDTRVQVLPNFRKDTTDRNRTSPFAFTGNKFEFRMAGSSASISCPVYMLNTAVAESLSHFADVLENSSRTEETVVQLIQETYQQHKRIVFNGNNYSEEWVAEAERRGLLNLKTTVDALPHYTDKKNLQLFRKHRIFTDVELFARQEILFEEYCNLIGIEAMTMLDMANKQILPAAASYLREIAETALQKKKFMPSLSCELEEALVANLSTLNLCLYHKIHALDQALLDARNLDSTVESARSYAQSVIPRMSELRAIADELETVIPCDRWPFPTYGELLFSL